MESNVRRQLGSLELTVIAVCAGLTAHAAAHLVDADLAAGKWFVARQSSPQALRWPATLPLPAAPFSRNIFCSTCPVGGAHLVQPSPPDPADRLYPSEMPLRLLATMVAAAPADAGWSIAVIQDTDTRRVGPYAVGSPVRGAAITRIEAKRVYLRVGQRQEYLDLLGERPPVAKAGAGSSTLAPAPSSAAGEPLITALERSIKQLGPRRYEVQRAALDLLLANLNTLSSMMQVKPETRAGRATGLRLLNVQPGGPIARIGLQSGDIISTINGLDLGSVENALVAYTKLRSASHLEIGLERAGMRLINSYDIR